MWAIGAGPNHKPMHYYDSQRHYSYNQMLMGLINEQVTRTPFYGVPRMTAWLNLLGFSEYQKLSKATGSDSYSVARF